MKCQCGNTPAFVASLDGRKVALCHMCVMGWRSRNEPQLIEAVPDAARTAKMARYS